MTYSPAERSNITTMETIVREHASAKPTFEHGAVAAGDASLYVDLPSLSSSQKQKLQLATKLARSSAQNTERQRALPEELVHLLAEAGCFQMLSPRDVGGVEVTPREMILVLEEIAAADGASGWCTMIGATSGLMTAFLEPSVAREMFRDPHTVSAGVFAPVGKAYRVEGGYRVSGRWPFTSGVTHSRWRMGGAIVYDGKGGKPVIRPDGTPEVVHLVLEQGDTQIVDTWKTSGLRGTGSHDMVAEDAFVPNTRSLTLTGEPKHQGALYSFPFYGLLALGIAGVTLGLARSSLETFRQIAITKKPAGSNKVLAEKEGVQERYALADAAYRSARAFVLSAVAEVEANMSQTALSDELPSDLASSSQRGPSVADRATIRLAATEAVRRCTESVDICYTACGMTSVFDESVLQRNFRDIHLITQHFMVNEATRALAGRVLLGLGVGSSQL
jgi:indole-3-acetate monooxygenase